MCSKKKKKDREREEKEERLIFSHKHIGTTKNSLSLSLFLFLHILRFCLLFVVICNTSPSPPSVAGTLLFNPFMSPPSLDRDLPLIYTKILPCTLISSSCSCMLVEFWSDFVFKNLVFLRWVMLVLLLCDFGIP